MTFELIASIGLAGIDERNGTFDIGMQTLCSIYKLRKNNDILESSHEL